MRRALIVTMYLLFFLLGQPVFADSERAYRDYLFQSDQYRRAFSAFTIAKNEYEKFRSLASQTDALEKTKTMLAARDQLLRSYLLLLIEKLLANPGMGTSTRELYVSLLGGEVSFLDSHTSLISGIGSIEDAERVSQQLISHYGILQISMHQTITALILANLNSLAVSYDRVLSTAQQITIGNREALSPEKRAIVNRWILQIQNKLSLYQQNIDMIGKKSSALRGSSQHELDRAAVEIVQEASNAKQYLVEGTSFLGELITAVKYEN